MWPRFSPRYKRFGRDPNATVRLCVIAALNTVVLLALATIGKGN